MSLNNMKRPGIFKTFAELHLKSRPQVNFTACTGCARCKRSCPTEALNLFAAIPNIELRPKTGEPRYRPEAKLSICIRCYRCQEQCPRQAIKKFKPRLMKILRL